MVAVIVLHPDHRAARVEAEQVIALARLGAEAEPAPPAARRDQCPDFHAVHEYLEHRVARQAFHGHVEPSFAGRAEDEAGAPALVLIDAGCAELRDDRGALPGLPEPERSQQLGADDAPPSPASVYFPL